MSQELEIRASQLADVSFPKRLIDLIVMPYETETQVALRGKMVGEIVSRGAFDGIQARPNRVKANRDHMVERTFGKAVAFYPSREEGLVAQIYASETVLGDETLMLAQDGVLDASAGFRVKNEPGAEVWENRGRRRLNKLWLAHIALVPDPAYESANVLAVRQAPEPVPVVSGMPNRDRLQVLMWQEQYELMDARWGVYASRQH